MQQKQRSKKPALRAFGRWLSDLRGKGRTREQISNRLKSLDVPLGGSTLAQYEKGSVWAPDPGVLWGLSRIYGVQLEEMIWLLRANRASPDIQDPRELQLKDSTKIESELTDLADESRGAINEVAAGSEVRLLLRRWENEQARVAATRDDLGQKIGEISKYVVAQLGDLATIVSRLPRRQAAMARGSGPGSSRNRQRRRRRDDQKRPPETPPD